MTDQEQKLDALLAQYRSQGADLDTSAGFMPGLWEKIDARRAFVLRFRRLSQCVLGASAAMILMLVGVSAISPETHSTAASYVDVLAEAHTTAPPLLFGIPQEDLVETQRVEAQH